MIALSPAAQDVSVRVRSPVLQRIASFPVMLGSLLVALGVLTVRSRFDDPDMWWHLKMGEVICRTRAIPKTDLFSYTTHHQAYVAHEWLSQITIFLAYRFGGYSGVMLWLCVLTAALLVAAYVLCALYSGNAKVALLGALLVWLFATIGLAARPQMIGYLLLILELLVLHRGKSRDPRWFFALPPMFAIWVCCHGSFIVGLIVASVVAFCSFFQLQWGLIVEDRWEARSRRLLLSALGLSVFALFLNPAGTGPIFYPVNTLLHQPIGTTLVSEWQPLHFSDPRALPLLATVVGVLLLSIVRASNLYLHEVLLLGLGTYAACSHTRMLFVFGILAAPTLTRLLADTWEGYDPEQDRLLPNTVLIVASLLTAFWAFPKPSLLQAQVDQENPVRAVDFIRSHHLAGPIINDYVYGGYLMWAAPEYPVFIDGRADVFEWTGVFGEFANWATLQSDPNTLPDKYGVNLCLLSSQSPTAKVLPYLHEWKLVYSDSQAVVFARVR